MTDINQYILSHWKTETREQIAKACKVSVMTVSTRCKVLKKDPICPRDQKVAFILDHMDEYDMKWMAEQLKCSRSIVQDIVREINAVRPKEKKKAPQPILIPEPDIPKVRKPFSIKFQYSDLHKPALKDEISSLVKMMKKQTNE